MTIEKALARLDELKPNQYDDTTKIEWLDRLDRRAWREVVETHEGHDGETFEGYDDDTPRTRVLLIPAPYDEAYIHYMASQVDYFNGEFTRYNNGSMMFNQAYQDWQNSYHDDHKPKQKNVIVTKIMV